MAWLARHRAAVAASAAALAVPGAADAHGPCRCTHPVTARPGELVRTGTAYRILWNPAPADFRGQTTPVALASGHRADAPTVEVLRRPLRRPPRRASFRVPDGTPPGIYLVLAFDGSEGGAHTTWDHVQVPGRPPRAGPAGAAVGFAPAPRRPAAAGGAGFAAGFAAGAGGLLLGAVALLLLARRRRS